MKYLTVKDLISILQEYDQNLPVIVTHSGKDHQYGINDEGIEIVESAYFGNDPDADDAFGEVDKYLNIGYI
jgi:hypothetical protein